MKCSCCHRVERRTADGGREVVVAGGLRRPDGVPQRAAWETLRASLAGALAPVVGTCPACGQPMVGEGPREGYRIPVRGGDVELRADGTLSGPDGPLDPAAAGQLVHAAWPEPRIPLAPRIFGVIVLLAMLVPAAIGLFMMWFVFWYLSHVSGA